LDDPTTSTRESRQHEAIRQMNELRRERSIQKVLNQVGCFKMKLFKIRWNLARKVFSKRGPIVGDSGFEKGSWDATHKEVM
jgi:hypothetical protein